MKKLFFLFFAMIVTSVAIAQKISYDNVDSKGYRSIFASKKRTGDINQSFVLWTSMSTTISPEGNSMFFVVFDFTGAYDITIQPKSKVLLKTVNDDTVTLESINETPRRASVEPSSVGSIYSLRQSYKITEEDLPKLFDGVQKIRIQLDCKGSSVHDREYSGDKIGTVLKKDYALLLGALKEKKVSPQKLDEGF